MADPIKLDPLGTYGDVVVIDASPLLHARPTSITRLPPRGSDTGPEILFAAGYQRTVVAVLQSVKNPLSLLIVDAVNSSDWLFYDITVTAL